jgi:hypothetical protein
VITFDPPSPAEAAREYQLAVEHERWGRTLLGDVLSAEDDLARAAVETEHYREQLVASLARHDVDRLLDGLS